jgi:hypothetical protein
MACLCPTVGPGDSGELTLAAWKLGICHPPGYPLFTWLGRLAALLPFSEPAFRTNLLTAFLAAAAVSVLYFAARALALSRFAAVAASLGLALSLTFWTSALSHEVYALTLLFFCVALLLAQRAPGNPRLLPVLGFVLGLAAAHQPTSLLWLPGLAAFVLARRPGRRPVWGSSLVLGPLSFVLGFSSSLGILFRSLARPEINWGDPSTLGRFLGHVFAAQYKGLALSAGASAFSSRLLGLPGTWLSEAGLVAALLTLSGFVGLFVSRRNLAGLLLLLGTAAFGLSYRVPDYTVHLLPAFAVLFLVAGKGIDFAAGVLKRLRPMTAFILALAALLPAAIRHFPLAREYRTTAIRDMGEDLLSCLPDSSAYVFGADVMGNSVQYVRSLRGPGFDVTPVSARMLLSATYWCQLQPTLGLPDFDSALVRAGNGTLEQRLQLMLGTVVNSRAGMRVFFGHELMTQWFFNSPLAGKYRPVPRGLVNELLPLPDTVPKERLLRSNDRLWQAFHPAGRRFRLPAFQQVPVTYALSRNNLGMYYMGRGWREEAIANLNAALSFPTNDEFRAAVLRNLARAQSSAPDPRPLIPDP